MTQWLESGPDISVECEWLLHKVTAVAEWQFSGTPPCRTMLKTSSHHKQWPLTTKRNELIISRETLTCPREPFDVPLWIPGGVLTLWRGDAHFIVLPSVTSVCVLGCLGASPSPPSAHNSGVPSESLASSPVHTAVERSDCERLALPLLIGQG